VVREDTVIRVREPDAPAAVLEGPITVGSISPPLDPRNVDLAAVGYVEEEWFASGTASRYAAVGELTTDGVWELEPVGSAPYATRLVVRRPADPGAANGVVALEWLNVSALELSPDWSYVSDAITDDGVTWVGVSAQALGIVGGGSLIDTGSADQDSANQGIRSTNPQRYGSLDHPGDAFAYDIYSQVAAALRSPAGAAVLGGAPLDRLLAVGESQSAGWLTSYVNGFQPTTDLFDGFFVHSRGSAAAGLDVAGPVYASDVATRFRTDLDMPVMVLEAETDVGTRGRYALARQPETERLRVWEMAGTAHSDTYMVGDVDLGCGRINDGPHHWIAKAAFAALVRWVTTGEAPTSAPPLESDGTTLRRDVHGNPLGGVRTPPVDVPTSVLSGDAAPGAPVICTLLGTSTPFDDATLRALYPSRAAYLEQVEASLDRAIAAGFIRAGDRDAYLAEAGRAAIPS
jgi:hypothetical protein